MVLLTRKKIIKERSNFQADQITVSLLLCIFMGFSGFILFFSLTSLSPTKHRILDLTSYPAPPCVGWWWRRVSYDRVVGALWKQSKGLVTAWRTGRKEENEGIREKVYKRSQTLLPLQVPENPGWGCHSFLSLLALKRDKSVSQTNPVMFPKSGHRMTSPMRWPWPWES